ncbi:MAG: hypothetical protein ACP5O1_11970 [Phycisphaerae bacterium]
MKITATSRRPIPSSEHNRTEIKRRGKFSGQAGDTGREATVEQVNKSVVVLGTTGLLFFTAMDSGAQRKYAVVLTHDVICFFPHEEHQDYIIKPRRSSFSPAVNISFTAVATGG